MCFWMIRRTDTGEWIRQCKGPSWAKRSKWVKEREKGKAYGSLKNAIASVGAYGKGTNRELVRFKVIEEGVEHEGNLPQA